MQPFMELASYLMLASITPKTLNNMHNIGIARTMLAFVEGDALCRARDFVSLQRVFAMTHETLATHLFKVPTKSSGTYHIACQTTSLNIDLPPPNVELPT